MGWRLLAKSQPAPVRLSLDFVAIPITNTMTPITSRMIPSVAEESVVIALAIKIVPANSMTIALHMKILFEFFIYSQLYNLADQVQGNWLI
jgi:phosphoribulokinase